MKILNLYACLGGNRYKWNEVKDDIEITAIELDPELARLYQERFPNDRVIIADAHQYLLDHYKEFEFIWSSPPCPSHSRINISQYTRENWKPRYPEMKLYQEIIFLDNFYKGKYCIENVIPYYKPLIAAKKRDRHLYWTNFNLPNILSKRKSFDISRTKNLINALSKFHDYDFRKYKGKQLMNKIARNLVDYEAGKTIFETMLGIVKEDTEQITLKL
jgi:DNA (cytosine-5)-methyltransferase 1|tara:strand:- start:212 stop:862 length:651 start_codon:yes stop_codon:yes gene_type:complete